KDGRWFITHGMGARDLKNLVPLLSKYNAQADLQPPPPEVDLRARQVPGTAGSDEARSHMLDVVQRFVRAWTYKDMPWREAQDAGLLWAPLRKPHENALDEHWLTRKTFAQIERPSSGCSIWAKVLRVSQCSSSAFSCGLRSGAQRSPASCASRHGMSLYVQARTKRCTTSSMCDRASSLPAVPGTCRARKSTSGGGGWRSACALYLLNSGTRFFRSRAPIPWVMNQRPSLVWQMLGEWFGPSDA